MTERLSVFLSDGFDPVRNLAAESALCDLVKEGEMILYLWQNDHTVVIGRNQNIWKECSLAVMEQDGITPVRRPSGGGAVWHDAGNLNYTFITHSENYSEDRQYAVLRRALQACGISAQQSGRNDLLVNGKKISGSAYRHHDSVSFQHGTLLICCDVEKMMRYLRPSDAKLKANSVDSVRSRVMNLCEIRPDLTIREMRDQLIRAAEAEYGMTAQIHEEIPSEVLRKYMDLYGSREWIYGRNSRFEKTYEKRFAWGSLSIEIHAEDGIIRELSVWSDALQTEIAEEIHKLLEGVPASAKQMAAALETASENTMVSDVMNWLRQEE
ncbi:MAG: lipoate--protein ligase [Solobacterium sp.]|nr:lipoate--protein ligase [Solobacterium sp.]